MLSIRPAVSSPEHPAAVAGQIPKRELLNTLLSHLAGGNKGRVALAKVFQWIYKGGPCIKTAVTCAVASEWDEIFLSDEQKEKIESGADPETFDRQLLYFLLENTCGLADADECMWTTPGGTLEYLIHQVAFGPSIEMGPMERLADFEECIARMLWKAGHLSGKDPHLVEALLTEIKQYFDQVRGIIESEPESVPQSIVTQIVDILSNKDTPSTDGDEGILVDYLLCLVEESKQDKKVIDLVVQIMKKCDQWTITGDMINGLGLLLDQVVPERMNLWFDSNPSPSRVQPALEDLAKRSVEVDLYTSSRSGEGASYLKALTGPGSLCKVTSCQGFVSGSTAEHLPASVTSLTISTDFQSLQALAAALARLEDLDWFSLGLTDDARPDPETLPPLPGPFMYIDSPRNLSSEDVPWWCHAARQLCPPSSQRRYSYMGVSLIKGGDSELLIRQLHERGVWAEDLLVTFSTSDVAIDCGRLQNLALELAVSDNPKFIIDF
ncbi:uncharacterized protein [Penaeus vannamei]|uniref:uncharacterized protein n=1 Tax=Penaeus vannamei TaxID=6689 RepID=UPI000F689A9D|nr:uncharacterized protein LOC113812816 [Penaeus vannamei]